MPPKHHLLSHKNPPKIFHWMNIEWTFLKTFPDYDQMQQFRIENQCTNQYGTETWVRIRFRCTNKYTSNCNFKLLAVKTSKAGFHVYKDGEHSGEESEEEEDKTANSSQTFPQVAQQSPQQQQLAHNKAQIAQLAGAMNQSTSTSSSTLGTLLNVSDNDIPVSARSIQRVHSASVLESNRSFGSPEALERYSLRTVDRPSKESRAFRSIDAETLVVLLESMTEEQFNKRFILIDCRYPYEFEGGHILNIPNPNTAGMTKAALVAQLIDQKMTAQLQQQQKPLIGIEAMLRQFGQILTECEGLTTPALNRIQQENALILTQGEEAEGLRWQVGEEAEGLRWQVTKRTKNGEKKRSADDPEAVLEYWDALRNENGGTAPPQEVKETPSFSGIPKGLPNLGNTCFYNSTMQCLLATHPLSHYFSEIQQRLERGQLIIPNSYSVKMGNRDVDVEKQTIEMSGQPQMPLYYAFKKFFDALTGTSRMDPRPVFEQICKKVQRFRGWNQQDAHELLRYLMDNLRQDEINHFERSFCDHYQVNFDDKKPEQKEDIEKHKLLCRALLEGPARPVLDAVFGGKLQHTIYCCRCHHISVCLEPFFDLSLPLHYQEEPVNGPIVYLPSTAVITNGRPSKPEKQQQSEDKQKGHTHKSKRNVTTKTNAAKTARDEKEEQPKIHDKREREKRAKEKKKQAREAKRHQKQHHIRKSSSVTQTTEMGDEEEDKGAEDEEKPTENGEKPTEEDSTTATEAASSLSQLPDSDPNVYHAQIEHNIVESEPNLQNGQEKHHPVENGHAENNKTEHEETDAGEKTHKPEEETLGPAEKDDNGSNSDSREDKWEDALEDFSSGIRALVLATTGGDDNQKSGGKSIIGALRAFTTEERLEPDGNNGYICSKCVETAKKKDKKPPQPATAVKRYFISTPPLILTLQLKRFEQVGTRNGMKKYGHVHFDMLLDLAPFCSDKVKRAHPGQRSLLYSLYGIVCHSGGLTGGHYIAYIRVRPQISEQRLKKFFKEANINHGNKTGTDEMEELEQRFHQLVKMHEMNGHPTKSDEFNFDQANMGQRMREKHAENLEHSEWYHCSDSYVHRVTEKDVLAAQAYMLFYERIY